jgi:hypothetical protein
MPLPRFHTVETISPNISKTAEGYLVCANVPIARVGPLNYAAGEIEGFIDATVAERAADDLFDPDTIASFEGKPVTVGHPRDRNGGIVFVDVDNWQLYSRGHAANVRPDRENGHLLADLVLTTGEAQQYVDAGIREVSAGYDAEYEEFEPGKARQKNIRGNHIAIVLKGRCGAECAIIDEETAPEGQSVKLKSTKLQALLARFTDAFKGKPEDLAAATAMIATVDSEMPEDDTPPPPDAPTVDERLGTLDERMKQIEDSLAALLATKKTGDEAPPPVVEADGALAEILKPGIQFKARAADEVMREALAGHETVVALLAPGKTSATVDAAALPVVFSAAAELARTKANAAALPPAVKTTDAKTVDQNQRNADYWRKQGVI